jgi:GTP 3',8-cyclase
MTTPDKFGRSLRDLRISLTDRCNFRCTYCMPKEIFGADYPYITNDEMLSFDEIIQLVKATVLLGVSKIRLTGGEPLLRRDIETLIERIAEVKGVKEIALTTNGSLLTARRARSLRQAGLHRVTISLDAVHEGVFAAMNDVAFPAHRILQAVNEAEAVGLGPIKINMVVKKGVNESQILPMAEQFRSTPHVLRMIEFMDVGHTNGWRLDDVVRAEDIISILQEQWALEPIARSYPGEVAKRYRYLDGQGEIGVISSVTQPFCSGCSRLRLSSDGKLYTCLFGSHGFDIRAFLREGQSAKALSQAIAGLWGQRDDRYSELRTEATTVAQERIEMSRIGG